MNLYQTIRTIETVAAAQPDVRTIVREDVFRLNAYKDTQYGVFAWLQGEHRTDIDRGLIQYAFTFFYVDRLTDGARNELEVQSVGVETLDNILRTLADLGVIAAGEYGFRTFNERFADACAGVFVNVRLEVPKDTLCADDYEFRGYALPSPKHLWLIESNDYRAEVEITSNTVWDIV